MNKLFYQAHGNGKKAEAEILIWTKLNSSQKALNLTKSLDNTKSWNLQQIYNSYKYLCTK